MSDELRDEGAQKTERRAFLEQCGRFAVVTPPVVALMLTVGDKAALATSGTVTVTTTVTTTTPVGSSILGAIMPQSRPTHGSRLARIVDSMGLMKS